MKDKVTIRDLARRIEIAKAAEYAVAAHAVREINAHGIAKASAVDSVTVAAPLRRDGSGVSGGPMTGCVIECVTHDGVAFGLAPFFGIGAERGRWKVLGDGSATGNVIDGMVSNDHPGDPVKLVRRVVREIAKREAHIRTMC